MVCILGKTGKICKKSASTDEQRPELFRLNRWRRLDLSASYRFPISHSLLSERLVRALSMIVSWNYHALSELLKPLGCYAATC